MTTTETTPTTSWQSWQNKQQSVYSYGAPFQWTLYCTACYLAISTHSLGVLMWWNSVELIHGKNREFLSVLNLFFGNVTYGEPYFIRLLIFCFLQMSFIFCTHFTLKWFVLFPVSIVNFTILDYYKFSMSSGNFCFLYDIIMFVRLVFTLSLSGVTFIP